MLIIPIADVPSQVLSVQLAGQGCDIKLYQKSTGLFMDLAVGGTMICAGVVCENLNTIVRSEYLSFIGDFIFQDTAGSSDPSYPGLGTRFLFCFLEEVDADYLESVEIYEL